MNGPAPLHGHSPATPKRASSNIDVVIQAIADEFHLPLKAGVELVSPSERHRASCHDTERCISSIRFLFFNNRPVLELAVRQLRTDRREKVVHGRLLHHFLAILDDFIKLEKARKGSDRIPVLAVTPRSVHEHQLRSLSKSEGAGQPSSRSPSNRHSARKKSALRQTTLSWPSSKLDLSQTKSREGLATPANPEPRKRRCDNESHPHSSKYVRCEGNETAAQRSDASASFASSRATSVKTSFATSVNVGSRVSINATSFATALTGEDEDEDAWDHSDLDVSQAERLMTSFDQSRLGESFATRLSKQMASTAIIADTHDDSMSDTEPDSEDDLVAHKSTRGVKSHTIQLSPARYSLRSGSQTNSCSMTHTSPSRPMPRVANRQGTSKARINISSSQDICKVTEPCWIRDLPQHGLFSSDYSRLMDVLPFNIRWEACRVANHLSMSLGDVHINQNTTIQGIYDSMKPLKTHKQPFARSPSSLLSHGAQEDILNIAYKVRLVPSPQNSSRKKLFGLHVMPLQSGPTSRLQRAFGSHRFLYIDIPGSSKIPVEHGSKRTYTRRLREWLSVEKSFLGVTWHPFHVQPIKDGNGSDKELSGYYRAVLFATSGPGMTNVSIGELLDWIVPLRENLEQPFCKAYARIDLSLKQTKPTIRFRPSQVQFVRDTPANAVPDDTSFNDPCLTFSSSYDGSTVMNDGCSKISVGAAKMICEMLGVSGMKPVSFQGRINGCKGIWSMSAPYDTADPQQQAIWIQVTESQRKVVPSVKDLQDSTCDVERWTFDVVKPSGPPKPSNLYLGFMPILQDRHVSREILCRIVSERLQMDFENLYDSLDDPPELRCWVHKQSAHLEETNRDVGIAWEHGFPEQSVEQIILLVESGFRPKACPQLASSLTNFVSMWTQQLREKLKVPLARSTMVYGIADPTPERVLKPGEIYLGFSKPFEDEDTSWSHLNGEVLVARHPSLRRSDIQKVKAVYKEELSHLRDVVVFPTQGHRPLADKLQGGDYDGDTFWICWDSRITAPFLNAPAPVVGNGQLENLSVKVDSRRLGEILGVHTTTDQPKLDAMDVNNWIARSFDFRLQDDLLGQVTNLHKRQAYKENSISSKSVTDIVDLHDLIIDSAKNGYTFDSKAFKAFKRKRDIVEPEIPAYEKQLSHQKSKGVKGDDVRSYNKDHIIDVILFEVVNPRISIMKKHLESLLEPATPDDPDLANPYLDYKQRYSSDPIITETLESLVADLKHVETRWTKTMNGGRDRNNPKHQVASEKCYLECYNLYCSINPTFSRDSHPIIHTWTQRRLQHEFSTWDLLRASAFYYERHMNPKYSGSKYPTGPALVFRVAGGELCYLKAFNNNDGVLGGEVDGVVRGSRRRVIVDEVYRSLKPRKGRASTRIESGGSDGWGNGRGDDTLDN